MSDKPTTLEEFVISLYERGQKDTPLFLSLISFYGKEKIEKILKDYLARPKVTQGDLW